MGAAPESGRSPGDPGRAPSLLQAPPVVRDVLQTSGSALDDETRQDMQARFTAQHPVPGRLAISMATAPVNARTEDAAEQAAGQAMAAPVRAQPPGGAVEPPAAQDPGDPDFGDVRVHAGPAAARAAGALGAPAFTVGPHIVFGTGRFDAGSEPGQRLLAHELAHVVQQRQRPLTTTDPIPRGPQDPPAGSPASPSFPVDLQNQAPPPLIRGSVDVAAPSLAPGRRATVVPLRFDVPVTPIEIITRYAVPDQELFETAEAAALRPGKDRDDQSFRVRGWPIPPAAPQAAPVSIPPVTPSAGARPAPGAAAPPASLGRFHTSAGPVDIVARGEGFGITGSYTKLAVGAGSTTVADTPRGLIVIDAGDVRGRQREDRGLDDRADEDAHAAARDRGHGLHP